MRQSIRRLVALILALAMCLSLLSSNVWAAELEPPSEDGSAFVQSSEGEEPVETGTETEEEAEEAEGIKETPKEEDEEVEVPIMDTPAKEWTPTKKEKFSVGADVLEENENDEDAQRILLPIDNCDNSDNNNADGQMNLQRDEIPKVSTQAESKSLKEVTTLLLRSSAVKSTHMWYQYNGNMDIRGYKDGNTIKTTYNDNGYYTVLKCDDSIETISFSDNDNTGSHSSGLTITPKIAFSSDGTYAIVRYAVKNETNKSKTFSLGVNADIDIDTNDNATIQLSKTGLKMTNSNTKTDYYLVCKNVNGISNVDTLWFGYFNDRTNNQFESSSINQLKDTDSGIAFSWKNRTISAGETAVFSYQIGIGDSGSITEPEEESTTAISDPQILSFKYDYYSCIENSSVGVALNCYTGQNKLQKISFSCSDDSVTFSEPTVYGMHLLDDGDWVISTHATCKKAGKYTITATVDGYTAQTTIGVLPEEPSYIGYSAEKESTTKEQYVQRRFNDLKNAIDNYLKVLNNAVKADSNAPARIDQLMEKDQAKKYPALTLDPQMSEDKEAKLAAYAGLNAFYEYMADREPGKLKKIDLSHPVSQIAIDLTNDVFQGNFLYREKMKYNERCIVSVDISGYWSSFSGSITVTTPTHRQYKCVANDPEAAIQTMALYIKELRDLEADVMEEGVKSYMREMRKVSYLSDITKEQFTELFSSIYDYAKKKGYGKITKYAAALYDGYTISKQISSIKSEADLQKKLDSADELLTQLEKLNYTDASIKDKTIKGALEVVEKADKAVEDALYNYMFHPDQNMDIEKDIKDKIRDKVTNVWNKTNKAWKKITGQCPVTMTVRSKNGSVLGYAEDNYCEYDDSIFIDVNGDVKTIYVPDDMDITVEMTGTGSGTMTYTIEEYVDRKPVGRKNFYNVPLEKNGVYTQSISSGSLGTNVRDNPLTTDKGNTVIADEYISADENAACTITCESTEGGVVYGATTYARGDVVQMSAVPQDGYYFDGWYLDAQIVEIDTLYHFPAVNDTNLQAVFKKKEAGQPVSDYLGGKCGNNTIWSLDENGTLTVMTTTSSGGLVKPL